MKWLALCLVSVISGETPPTTQQLYMHYFDTEDIFSLPSGVDPLKHDHEIIVSLTSYPERIETTGLAIESLLRQTLKPNRIILNLFEGEFPDHKLPELLELQLKRGLEINWCPENHKVFLKVIPTLQKYKNAWVISIDDDSIYSKDLIKELYETSQLYPKSVIAKAVRQTEEKDGHIPPIAFWKFSERARTLDTWGPSQNLIPEGYQGVLYPSFLFSEDSLKNLAYKNICPSDDDLWMYYLTVQNELSVVKIPSISEAITIFGSQNTDQTLFKQNEANNYQKYNDAFQKLLESYFTKSSKKLVSYKQFIRASTESPLLKTTVSNSQNQDLFRVPVSFNDGFYLLMEYGLPIKEFGFEISILWDKFNPSETPYSLYLKGIPLAFLKETTGKYLIFRKSDNAMIGSGTVSSSTPYFLIQDSKNTEEDYVILTDLYPFRGKFLFSFIVNEIELEKGK
jgi:hypothetical protein